MSYNRNTVLVGGDKGYSYICCDLLDFLKLIGVKTSDDVTADHIFDFCKRMGVSI